MPLNTSPTRHAGVTCKAQCIQELCTRWGWVVSFILQLLFLLWKDLLMSIKEEASWAPKPAGYGGKEKNCCPFHL
jgi:hypothetical protein